MVIFYKWIWTGGVQFDEEYRIKPYTVSHVNNEVITILPSRQEAKVTIDFRSFKECVNKLRILKNKLLLKVFPNLILRH